VPAQRALAAGSQVLLDQGNGRARKLRSTATIADAVAADVMEGAVRQDEVMYSTDRDLGRCCGRGDGLAEDAADA
jgi:hypothetical protein